jgi:hypothetical protein
VDLVKRLPGAQGLTGDNDLMKVESCGRGGGSPVPLGDGDQGYHQPSPNAEHARRVLHQRPASTGTVSGMPGHGAIISAELTLRQFR